ncbi:ATP-binding cassette domain-containing protein [Algiphilus sp.]|uniref:ATP-binding cassette domain-containing protein n=1 Tax=Algiphilus sp. TaxID=1872431 RepID=UPI0025BDEEBA|nr:ATP-binding cassette domain-containing protein [Algiphilus sp.]MCK5768919.1 ATP-binding cassette domain-containing protein [Algiphilus sp.]
MITASHLTLRRGEHVLFSDAGFTLHAGWRVGLVGRNGCGKSSLFEMMLGRISPDQGDLSLQRGIDIATVAQETPALAQSALDYALDGDVELRRLEAELEPANAAGDGEAIGRIHERLHAIGGYAARSRAARLLDGLGFDTAVQEAPVSAFSGGWRMRLNLAQALMRRADLMLLDEPTNHLDLDAVLWVQEWLRHFQGTLVVVSHDRDFLDAVTDHTLHIGNGAVTLYDGNFSSFERQRAEHLAQQAAQHAKQQAQLAHMQAFVDRFRAQATKARQAQSRLKAMERMQQVAPVRAEAEFRFSFPKADSVPSPLLRMDGARAAYGDTTVLRDLKLGLEPGDRVGLLGRNGAGKSTLVKLMGGRLQPASGQLMRAPGLRVGYFDQHQVDALDPRASPMLLMQRLDPEARDQPLRNWLGRFHFQGDRVFQPIAPLSGGEKARLGLAMLVYQQPNLLLLDEPTNHLDMDMRSALEEALLSFEGAMVLVTHDRHLVGTTCDRLWLVAGGGCRPFDGDLDDYARWLLSSDSRDGAGDGGSKPARSAQETKSLRATVRRLERDMERQNQKLQAIEAELADPALYDGSQKQKIARLERERSELRASLAEVEALWLEAAETLESG